MALIAEATTGDTPSSREKRRAREEDLSPAERCAVGADMADTCTCAPALTAGMPPTPCGIMPPSGEGAPRGEGAPMPIEGGDITPKKTGAPAAPIIAAGEPSPGEPGMPKAAGDPGAKDGDVGIARI